MNRFNPAELVRDIPRNGLGHFAAQSKVPEAVFQEPVIAPGSPPDSIDTVDDGTYTFLRDED
jgi:hypothetical protein